MVMIITRYIIAVERKRKILLFLIIRKSFMKELGLVIKYRMDLAKNMFQAEDTT